MEGKTVEVHRLVWELEHGPIPGGMVVAHSCDNPPCAEGSHLFLTTHAGNLADMRAKSRDRGRGPKDGQTRGEANSQSRLTEDDVRAMRAEYALGLVSLKTLGGKYGISAGQAHRIIRREQWGHV